MRTIRDNVNDIGDLSQNVCQIRGYVQETSTLCVEVLRLPNALNLFFRDVRYFSGMMQWHGGTILAFMKDRIEESPTNDKVRILGFLNDLPDYRFFVFENTNPQIQIIAHSVFATDNKDEFLF
jgi:hypothetical protein